MFHALFRPGTAVLNTFNYPWKFTALATVALAPMLLVMWLYLGSVNEKVTFAEQELGGVSYYNAVAKTWPTMDAVGEPNWETTKQSWQDVTKQNEHYGKAYQTDAFYNAVSQGLQKGYGDQAPWQTQAQWRGAVWSLMAQVGDKSNLILDPEMASYYMVDANLFKLTTVIDSLNKLTDAAKDYVGKGPLSSEQETALMMDIATIRATLDASSRNMELVYSNSYTPNTKTTIEGTYTSTKAAVLNYITWLEEHLVKPNGYQAGETWADVDSKAATALNASYKLFDTGNTVITDLLNHRVHDAKTTQTFWSLVVAALMLVLGYMLVSLYHSIKEAVDTLDYTTSELASGNLTIRAPKATRAMN